MADGSDNPYIRTYAKDVAALGKTPEVPVGKPVAQAAATPAPTTAATAPADPEREAVLARLRERAAKDPVQEADLLPNSLPTPLPIAGSTDEAIPAAPPSPSVAPAVVVPPPAPPPMPPPPSPLPPPPPVPVPPPPSPVPAPAPVSPAASESPLHTYKSDFADHIDTKGASTFSVLAAEADTGKLRVKSSPLSASRLRTALITVLGLVLIVGGAGAGYAAYRYVAGHNTVVLAPSVPSLVFADDRQALTGEGPQLLQALAASADSPLADGQVRVVYLTEASTTPDGKPITIPLAGGRLIGSLQLSAPDLLLRNIAPESTVGVVHAGTETRAFFIMKVMSYERTFAGMLSWEGTLESALETLYPQYPLPEPGLPTIATTTRIVNGKKVTATTTIPAAPVVVIAPRFIDEVTSNHDVRALKDGQGRTILLYGYKDKETLIIARDEAAFGELLRRLAATKQQ